MLVERKVYFKKQVSFDWLTAYLSVSSCSERGTKTRSYPLGYEHFVDAAYPDHGDSLLLTQSRNGHEEHRQNDGGPHWNHKAHAGFK